MDKSKPKSTSTNLKSQTKAKQALIQGSIVAILLALTPYFFSIHESVPEQKLWDTFLFTYDSKAWENVNLVMWILTGKAIPLGLLFIWFFTCRHWWYHALLVPIVMYVYQIFALFNEDQSYIDELNFLYMIPVMAVIVPSVYLIRAKLFNKLNDVDKSMEELEQEFMMKPKGFWGTIKQYF
ncbi:MAG: hypothetical protein WA775_12700 [Psychroserpens sp.]|uniref:hypothetical protein n=1 Tax=Psychroserpens sp. TaxID=2020870 RepID=UPI003C780590